MRNRVLVLVLVIRIIVIVIGTDPTIIFKGRPGKMGTESTNTLRLAQCLLQGQLQKSSRTRLTGGADTRLGRERLVSSRKTSSKLISEWVFGGVTNPSLIWTEPEASVVGRADTSDKDDDCDERRT